MSVLADLWPLWLAMGAALVGELANAPIGRTVFRGLSGTFFLATTLVPVLVDGSFQQTVLFAAGMAQFARVIYGDGKRE